MGTSKALEEAGVGTRFSLAIWLAAGDSESGDMPEEIGNQQVNGALFVALSFLFSVKS